VIDRFGKTICVGWSAHEILWIEAAMSLGTRGERMQAFLDIASLTGRSYRNVRDKAHHLGQKKPTRDSGWSTASANSNRVMVPSRGWFRQVRKPVLLPSDIPAPSRARLMGGRA
jgi:hypothetical protein